jgi:lincosamide nucleotidyltransferase A/C/D/E
MIKLRVTLLEKITSLADVVIFYTELNKMGIQIWIDGGWGVGALLGEQTRPHADLDIVIQQKDLQMVVELLNGRGYKNIERDDTSSWNFVLGDGKGREIDFHVIVFDDKGYGIYGPSGRGVMYPPDSLSGIGEIDGHLFGCISPEYMVEFHTGYKMREKDINAVAALCEKFGIDYSEKYLH